MYSFGVLLWEIITLERPLQRGNLREIRYVALPIHLLLSADRHAIRACLPAWLT